MNRKFLAFLLVIYTSLCAKKLDFYLNFSIVIFVPYYFIVFVEYLII